MELKLLNIKTLVNNRDASTREDVENILFTHWEKAEINHDAHTPIIYNRFNHIPFMYRIRLLNKNRERGNVFVRIFLGLINDDK